LKPIPSHRGIDPLKVPLSPKKVSPSSKKIKKGTPCSKLSRI